MKCSAEQADFENLLHQTGAILPYAASTVRLGEPVRIGRWTSPNRFVALPMEGCDAALDGTPGELTFRRYERMAAGGAGIIWLEACAVVPEGRSKPTALYLHRDNVGVYRALVDRMRAAARATEGHEILCLLQLTHSGRYCRPDGKLTPVVAHHSPVLDGVEQLAPDYPLITDDELDALQVAFVDAARLATAAGFDGVDIKACHGYLVSSLLGAHLRPGCYGGDYANRTRFLKETIARVRQALPACLVTSRLNVFDGISPPFGFGTSPDDANTPDLAEPLRLTRELADMGVPLLGVSLGFPRFDPHFGRPSADAKGEHPLVGIARFADLAGQIQRSIPQVPVVNGALAWLEGHLPHVAAGLVDAGAAAFIGQGRNSIAYPDSVRDMVRGAGFDLRKGCIACSGCAKLLRLGKHVGCIVRDHDVYALPTASR